MKLILSMCFVAVASLCYSQDNIVFKVITFSEGVMVGKQPVTFGMNVQRSKQTVTIPSGGYLGIITIEGKPVMMRESVRVDKVIPPIKKKKGPVYTEAHVNEGPPSLVLPLLAENPKSDFVGDSLFIYWGMLSMGKYFPEYGPYLNQPKNDGFKIEFLTLFEDLVSTQEVTSNTAMVIAPGVINSEPLIIKISSLKNKVVVTPTYVIRRSNTENSNQIPDGPDKYYYQCAFYELKDMRINMGLPIYHIIHENLTTTDPILKEYFSKLKLRAELNLIK